ncbi:hypothetical protein FNU76_20320 [Chitinimonas arctica]|uniref:Uncharacterized protein n=1 Tax=Chitinimonas arctica TaxID=2594795 RepID=A0A516SK31_9NEIS|nr:hypothetical protein [Chitinimonas arctica]QDQ28515.1 hypothetical protein FNU76_20320 [Chitinimonas arctica]
MPLPFQLGLRQHRHMVGLIRSDHGGRVRNVLGMAYSADMNPRHHILEQWGMDQASPRRAMAATVDQPLPRRHQVALSARLNEDLRHSLRSGFVAQAVGRHEQVSGVKGRIHLGPQHPVLTAGLEPLGGPQRGARSGIADTGPHSLRATKGKPSPGKA